jgi:Glycosyl hydrolases family 16
VDAEKEFNEITLGFGASPKDEIYFSTGYINSVEKFEIFNEHTALKFNQKMAQGWHNYSLIWTPTSLSYLIDGQVYW